MSRPKSPHRATNRPPGPEDPPEASTSPTDAYRDHPTVYVWTPNGRYRVGIKLPTLSRWPRTVWINHAGELA